MVVHLYPSKLSTIAADAYFASVYKSTTCSMLNNLVENIPDAVNSKEEFSFDLLAICYGHEKIIKLKRYLEVQKSLIENSSSRSVVKKYFTAQSKRLIVDPCEILMNIYLSEFIQLGHQEFRIIFLLSNLGIKCYTAKTLKLLDIAPLVVIQSCINVFPNLESIMAEVCDFSKKYLEIILKYANTLKVLNILCCAATKLTNDELCDIFFCGNSLDEIRKCYRNCTEPPLRFSKLEWIYFPIDCSKNIEFLKFFFHFHPKVDSHSLWTDNSFFGAGMSAFDRLWCYTIDLNPDHALSQCELVYEDLRFPYIVDCLTKWANLSYLLITIQKTGIPLDMNQCTANLKAILNNCKKLRTIRIVLRPSTRPMFFKSICEAAAQPCKRIVNLKICDDSRTLKYKHVVDLVNCFPALRSLFLSSCIELSIKFKTGDFKQLKDLDHLHIQCTSAEWSPQSKLIKILLGATKHLKYFHIHCLYPAFEFIGLIPLTVETLSIELIGLDLALGETILTRVEKSNVKELRVKFEASTTEVLFDDPDEITFEEEMLKQILWRYLRNTSIELKAVQVEDVFSFSPNDKRFTYLSFCP